MHEKVPTIIACLADVAWADGKLLPAESAFFRQVIDGLELSVEQEREAWRAVACPSEAVSAETVAPLSTRDRETILTLSGELASRDGEMSDEERRAIERLRALFSADTGGVEGSGA